MNWEWVKRRWQEFRWGHNVYLAFLLSLTNFLLISYHFLIESLPIHLELSFWILITVTCYVPLSIIVGHLHQTKQLKTDMVMATEVNPYFTQILEALKRIEERLEEK